MLNMILQAGSERLPIDELYDTCRYDTCSERLPIDAEELP